MDEREEEAGVGVYLSGLESESLWPGMPRGPEAQEAFSSNSKEMHQERKAKQRKDKSKAQQKQSKSNVRQGPR